MWVLKTFTKTFHLTDKQKDIWLAAIQNGAEVVDFGAFAIGKNIEYLISNEQARTEKLLSNPILADPDFAKVWTLDGSDDYQYRQKSALLETLNSRYPTFKYQEAWDEAMANKDSLKGLVKSE